MPTNFVNAPIENTFRTTLTQKLTSSNTDLVLYCAAVPTASIPGGQKVRVTINSRRGFTYQEDVLVSAIDTVNKTMTISSASDRGLARYYGDAGGLKEAPVLSEVIISDPYGLWLEVQNAVNAKVDKAGSTMTGDLDFSGTTHAGFRANNLSTAQVNALTGNNFNIVGDSTTGELKFYYGGSWYVLSAGSTQPNMSTTVAGKAEAPTQSEMDAGTAAGGTGALLAATPDVIQATIQKGGQLFCVLSGGTTAYTGTLTPAITAYTNNMRIRVQMNVANTGAVTLALNGLAAKSVKKFASVALASGDLPINAFVDLVYDGTDFIIVAISMPSQYLFGTGTDGQQLVKDAASSNGVKFVDQKAILIDTHANVAVTSSGTTAYSVTLPANTLRAGKKLMVRMNYVAGNSGGGMSVAIALKFGGTTMATVNSAYNAGGANGSVVGFLEFQALASAINAQTNDGKLIEKCANNGLSAFTNNLSVETAGVATAADNSSDITVTIVVTGTLTGSAQIQFNRCLMWVE